MANKSIGELNYFISNFMVPIKDKERLNKKELGGGAILEYNLILNTDLYNLTQSYFWKITFFISDFHLIL